MGTSVEEVASGRQMREFIRYPLRLYCDDPNFVPHLLSERREFFGAENPAFAFTDVHYLLARDAAGRLTGRLTAHVNHRYNHYWGERSGFFGFFEARDFAAAAALLDAAEERLRWEGMRRALGPFNFSTNHECGLLVEGFDRPPVLMMPYNRRSYPQFLTRFGYRPAKELLALHMETPEQTPDYFRRLEGRLRERSGARVRSLRPNHFQEDVRKAFQVYNRSWARNWGFCPMTEDQFAFTARQLKPIVDPELVLLAEAGRQPVGFLLALPDYNQVLKKMNGRLLPFGIFKFLLGRRRIDGLRVLTAGVVPRYRRRGIEALLMHRAFSNGARKGYRWGEFSWVLEENLLLRRALRRMGARPYKRYRIYEKPL